MDQGQQEARQALERKPGRGVTSLPTDRVTIAETGATRKDGVAVIRAQLIRLRLRFGITEAEALALAALIWGHAHG